MSVEAKAGKVAAGEHHVRAHGSREHLKILRVELDGGVDPQDAMRVRGLAWAVHSLRHHQLTGRLQGVVDGEWLRRSFRRKPKAKGRFSVRLHVRNEMLLEQVRHDA